MQAAGAMRTSPFEGTPQAEAQPRTPHAVRARNSRICQSVPGTLRKRSGAPPDEAHRNQAIGRERTAPADPQFRGNSGPRLAPYRKSADARISSQSFRILLLKVMPAPAATLFPNSPKRALARDLRSRN